MVRNLLLTYYQFYIQRLHKLKNTLIPTHSCIKILNKATNVFTSLFSATIPSAEALDVTGIKYELRLLVYHHYIQPTYCISSADNFWNFFYTLFLLTKFTWSNLIYKFCFLFLLSFYYYYYFSLSLNLKATLVLIFFSSDPMIFFLSQHQFLII